MPSDTANDTADGSEEKTWSFERWADRYDRTVARNSEYYARYDEILDFIAALAVPDARAGVALPDPGAEAPATGAAAAPRRVLDLGTGTGNLTLRCLARGADVVGLDPSEGMLAKAREKAAGLGRIAFAQAAEPFLSVPFPEASFDAVASTYAFHHVPHSRQPDSVREMFRVLRPGGVWVLGDLVFENEAAERKALREFSWLEEEYFVRLEELGPVVAALGANLDARQFTPVTWMLSAVKPGPGR